MHEGDNQMHSYGRLAMTGSGLTVAGVALSSPALVAIAIALVLVGLLLIRLGWQRGKALRSGRRAAHVAIGLPGVHTGVQKGHAGRR